MADIDVLMVLLANPQFVGAIVALIWNIGGYIAAMLKIKALEKYQVTKLVETLVMAEVVFSLLSSIGGLPISISIVGLIVVLIIRGIKTALDNAKVVSK